ncbi:hypothetical protein JCM17380_27360 [Desulfosporosinus burensis]
MIFRQVNQEEISLLFEQGYREWSKNRTFEQYCIDNSKEDAFGTRYVIEKNGEIVSSTIVLKLERINGKKAFGIGSVLTPQNHSNNGYATELLRKCVNLVYDENNIIFLYSEINPTFYEKLNFRILPLQLQRYEKSICMAYCKDEVWYELSNCNIDLIPNYF